MTAYATAEQLFPRGNLRSLDPGSSKEPPMPKAVGGIDSDLIDRVLARLADLVADRLMERTGTPNQPFGDWMDAREAAEYLGVHRDTLRKLAAERAVPVHQDGPGCKLYFRRDELDDWRRSRKDPRAGLRAVS